MYRDWLKINDLLYFVVIAILIDWNIFVTLRTIVNFKYLFVFKMAFTNIFLLVGMAHNEIVGNCFCSDCRERRIVIVRNHPNNHLYDLFTNTLPLKERSCLDKLFTNTLNQIVVGKVYKESSLQNSDYRYLGQKQSSVCTFHSKKTHYLLRESKWGIQCIS